MRRLLAIVATASLALVGMAAVSAPASAAVAASVLTVNASGEPAIGATVTRLEADAPYAVVDTQTTDEYGDTIWAAVEGLDTFIWLVEPDDGIHAPTFVGGAGTVASAEVFAQGDWAGVQLEVGPTISGTVTGDDGSPVANKWIYAYPANAASMDRISVQTDAAGDYTLTGLPVGDVGLRFTGGSAWAPEYWEDQQVLAQADLVTTASGGTYTGYDAVLSAGNWVTGTVSDHLGNDLEYVVVRAMLVDPTSGETTIFASTSTDYNGEYAVGPLSDGTYLVRFTNAAGFDAEYWDSTVRQSTATRITLAGGETVADVDADLVPLSGESVPAGTAVISGDLSVGSTLTAVADGWPADAELEYRWSIGGVAHDPTASPTLTLEPEFLGEEITVTVYGYRLGDTYSSVDSLAVGPVLEGTILPAPKPVIKGKAKVGVKLRARTGSWMDDTTLTYQWFANGSEIRNATSKTYVIRKKYQGDKIQVKVTASADGYLDRTRPSARTAKVKRR